MGLLTCGSVQMHREPPIWKVPLRIVPGPHSIVALSALESGAHACSVWAAVSCVTLQLHPKGLRAASIASRNGFDAFRARLRREQRSGGSREERLRVWGCELRVRAFKAGMVEVCRA